MFASSAGSSHEEASDNMATMPTSALGRALAALECGPGSAAEKRQLAESVDPTHTGAVRYEDFAALAALQLRRRRRSARDDGEDGDQVEAAFRLFLDAGADESAGKKRSEGEERITIQGLRRVAKELGSDGPGAGLGEDVLRNMIMEANGLGPDGVARGVGRAEFADVMRRAGVF